MVKFGLKSSPNLILSMVISTIAEYFIILIYQYIDNI
jgi:hypothetical protein